MRRLFFALCFLALPALVQAQTTVVPDTVFLEFFDAQNASGASISNFSVPLSTFQCDQAPVAAPTAPVRNGYKISFDDPARAGRACVWNSSTAPNGGPIFALPVRQNGYVAKASFIAAGVQGDPSAPSNPFFRTPGQPTNLRVGG